MGIHAIKVLCQGLCYLISFILVLLNVQLHHYPHYLGAECVSPNKDLIAQRAFLEDCIHEGVDEEMQELFPEGALFMQTLTALVNYHTPYYSNDSLRHELQQDTSSKILFSKDLPLENGAFYRGWRHLAYRHDKYLYREVAAALEVSKHPYLESYTGSSWPADMVVLMAAIQPDHRISYSVAEEDTIAALTRRWIADVGSYLDPATGMIPHLVEVNSGMTLEGARGSSSSLMLSLLPTLDSTFAEQQFQRYEKYFVTSRLGLPAIREYPTGKNGRGDIDSGPVIWGIGGAASIVGQRAAGVNGRTELFLGLRAAIQSFGAAFTWRGQRRYLFGQLPMVDAWTAWSNSIDAYEGPIKGRFWPWRFHLISVLIVALLVYTAKKL